MHMLISKIAWTSWWISQKFTPCAQCWHPDESCDFRDKWLPWDGFQHRKALGLPCFPWFRPTAKEQVDVISVLQ